MSRFHESLLQLALVAVFFAILGALEWIKPYQYRAAYLEGRFGLDHSTAINQAFQEGRDQCLFFTNR